MKLIKICLLLLTIFTANFAFAGEPAPNLPDSPKLKIIQGGGGYFPPAANDAKYATVITDGVKVAKIVPTVIKIASFASRASNAIGLVQLAYEGIMSGVDYVLDPANNQIRFISQGGDYCLETQCYPDKDSAVTAGLLSVSQYVSNRYALGLTASLLSTDANKVYFRIPSFTEKNEGKTDKNGAFHPPFDSSFVIISSPKSGTAPLSNVATNLQGKANAGDVAAQTLINQVVQDMINKNDDEILTALKSPQAVPYNDPLAPPVTNPSTNPDGSPNPNYNPQKDPQGNPLPVTNPSTNPDGSPSSGSKPFELPAFCSWASAVCEWQTWIKEKYNDTVKSVKDTYKEVKGFFTDEPLDPSDEDQIIKDQNVDIAAAEKSYIFFPAYCPVNPSFNFLGSVIVFPLNLICEGVSQFKIVIIAFAYLKALFIIGNAVRD